MYAAANLGAPGQPRPRFPDAGLPGRAVTPAALDTVREADAGMAGEDWVYAPVPAAAPAPAAAAVPAAAPAAVPAPATPVAAPLVGPAL